MCPRTVLLIININHWLYDKNIVRIILTFRLDSSHISDICFINKNLANALITAGISLLKRHDIRCTKYIITYYQRYRNKEKGKFISLCKNTIISSSV
ncbi:BAP_1a_G0000830.mRNA.1.CDS.1 [Saccharomyces cerevisiae]|nr:BAM_G0000810.mRNA.1.CDS.1 [Saccharomyces cerevisiae]CAI4242440.1 BAP_1a_G0000830.mRNA.1.CDS.1 [Saccharomyces cerevisiae]CAI7035251.1 BAM_G0000810.mRNA.1.CDS.1 [Saccharomyces cerevisiae]CAI7035619.1 BAP_1a_G0000830.mRNA.1.CDS.1 [Saccharomyces cerevisiae]